jgi:hypothetical protein
LPTDCEFKPVPNGIVFGFETILFGKVVRKRIDSLVFFCYLGNLEEILTALILRRYDGTQE